MNWVGKCSLKDMTVKICVRCLTSVPFSCLIFCLLAGYDKEFVRKYIKIFSDSTLASLFKGYYAHMTKLMVDDEEEASLYVPTDVDPVDTLLVRPILTR